MRTLKQILTEAATNVALRQRILDFCYKKYGHGSSAGRIHIADVAKALPDVPKQALDAELLSMQRDGVIVLMTLDSYRDITPADTAAAVNGDRYVFYLDKD